MSRAPGRNLRIFKALRQLEEIRAEYCVFENDADAWIIEPWNDHILGIGRYYNGEEAARLLQLQRERTDCMGQ